MKRWVAIVGVAGCEDVSSSDVFTSGMYADISAEADGTGGSQARVVLRAGGPTSNTYVELDGADALTVTVDGESLPMVHEHLGAIHHYVTTFATAPVGSPFDVAFTRALDGGAPSSVVTLPPEFTLAPPGVDTFSRLDEDLTIAWSPASTEPVRITIDGTCIDPFATDLASDGGQYVVARGTLAPSNSVAPDPCDLDVVVTRISAGDVDPAFGEGGHAEGRQVRSYHVSSTP
jgi:hypothetical protein